LAPCPLEDLVGGLAFTSACAVMLGGRRPRVLVTDAVMAGILEHLQEQRVEMGCLLLGTVILLAKINCVKPQPLRLR
jgi:hypothetical protein